MRLVLPVVVALIGLQYSFSGVMAMCNGSVEVVWCHSLDEGRQPVIPTDPAPGEGENPETRDAESPQEGAAPEDEDVSSQST